MLNNLRLVFCLFLVSCLLSLVSFAADTEYDGVFFMGFNMHKDMFEIRELRQAFNYVIDRKYIAKKLASTEVTPTGVIPPGMLGYDKVFKGYAFDLKKAKALLKLAGFSLKDERIKNITLLHTDGMVTRAIAYKIQDDLANIGVKVRLKQVPYSDQDQWNDELQSGRHHLFLMGYKAASLDVLYVGDKELKKFHLPTCTEIPAPDNQAFFYSYQMASMSGYKPCDICHPQPEKKFTTYDLLNPLFHSGGSANLTYYNSKKVDMLLDEAATLDPSLTSALRPKYEEINSIVLDDAPVVNLFYIQKL